jgi:internalin A
MRPILLIPVLLLNSILSPLDTIATAGPSPLPSFFEVCRNPHTYPREAESLLPIRLAVPGAPRTCEGLAARIEQEDSLDLEGRGIRNLTILASFPHLKRLNLSGHQSTDYSPLSHLTQLVELNLDWGEPRPLFDPTSAEYPEVQGGFAPLATLTQLKSLSLNQNGVRDLSPLKDIKSLESLNLAANRLTASDLKPLEELSHLHRLELSRNFLSESRALIFPQSLEFFGASESGLTDLGILNSLPTAIETLHLHRNQLTDLRQVSRFKNLKTLSVFGNQVTDLNPLQELQELVVLNASGNRIFDVSALSSLTSLQSLNLSENPIRDISPLRTLEKLRKFRADRCRLRSLTPLSGLSLLEELYLNENAITQTDALSSLQALQILGLARNRIQDIHPLAQLANLRKLSVADNQLTILPEDLSSWKSLQELYVAGNQLGSADSITPLQSVTHLDLSRNQIRQIPELTALTQLQYLFLRANQITDASPLNQGASLVWIEIAQNQIQDLSSILSFFETPIAGFDISGNPIEDYQPLIDALPENVFLSQLTLSRGSMTEEQIQTLREKFGPTGLTLLP